VVLQDQAEDKDEEQRRAIRDAEDGEGGGGEAPAPRYSRSGTRLAAEGDVEKVMIGGKNFALNTDLSCQ